MEMKTKQLLEDYEKALKEELFEIGKLKHKEELAPEELILFEHLYTHKTWEKNLDLLNSLNIDDDTEMLFPESNELISFDISKEDNMYHIVCDRLLYKNPAVYDDKFVWTQNKKKIVTAYRLALMKATNKIRISAFTEPIMVLFVQNFKNRKDYRDIDNFSSKVFIDTVIVKGGFIADDSPEFITALSIANINSDKTFSEVFIGYKNEVLNKLTR